MQYCSKKDQEKARSILYGDKGRGLSKNGKLSIIFHSSEGSKGNHFFPVLRGGVALPSEDDLTCCVQENTNTEEKFALERNRRWFDVHRRNKNRVG